MNPTADLEAQVIAFFGAWGESFDALRESLALLGDDGVWDQRPIPRLLGMRSAVRFMDVARRTMALDHVEVEVVRIASRSTRSSPACPSPSNRRPNPRETPHDRQHSAPRRGTRTSGR